MTSAWCWIKATQELRRHEASVSMSILDKGVRALYLYFRYDGLIDKKGSVPFSRMLMAPTITRSVQLPLSGSISDKGKATLANIVVPVYWKHIIKI